MTRCPTSIALPLALLLFALPAAAQEPVGGAPPPTIMDAGRSAEPDSAATEALAAARAALTAGEPGRAYEDARLARALDPRRSVEAWELMGRAAAQLDRFDTAHRFFRRALEVASPSDRRRLLAHMQLARAELGLVHLDVQPGGATVTIDGAPAEYDRGDRVVLLRPGARVVEARLPEHTPIRTTVHVTAGAERVVHMVLEPGAEDRTESVPGPRRVRSDASTTGNGVLLGVGTLGLLGAASASADAPPRLASLTQAQVGLSLGLVTGTAIHLVLQASFDPDARGDLYWPRVLAMPLLLGLTMASGFAFATSGSCAPNPDGPPCPADTLGDPALAATAGWVGGLTLATLGNVLLSGPFASNAPMAVGVTFVMLAGVEAMLALLGTSDAAAMREELEAQGGGAETAWRDAAAAETYARASAGLSAGFLALGALGITLGVTGVGQGDGGIDVAVSGGPGRVQVSGSF